MISFRISLAALTAVSTIAACGGNVVVDRNGSGGAATTTSSTTTETGGVGGQGGFGGQGGSYCDSLQSSLVEALADAQACNPALSVPQCSGVVTALDTCGCEVVAKDQSVKLASVAVATYESWVSEGCGPYDCFACPPPPNSPWYCDPTEKKCKPAFEK